MCKHFVMLEEDTVLYLRQGIRMLGMLFSISSQITWNCHKVVEGLLDGEKVRTDMLRTMISSRVLRELSWGLEIAFVSVSSLPPSFCWDERLHLSRLLHSWDVFFDFSPLIFPAPPLPPTLDSVVTHAFSTTDLSSLRATSAPPSTRLLLLCHSPMMKAGSNRRSICIYITHVMCSALTWLGWKAWYQHDTLEIACLSSQALIPWLISHETWEE